MKDSKRYVLFWKNTYSSFYNSDETRDVLIGEVYATEKKWREVKKALKSKVIRAQIVSEKTYNPVVTIKRKDVIAYGTSPEQLKRDHSIYFI